MWYHSILAGLRPTSTLRSASLKPVTLRHAASHQTGAAGGQSHTGCCWSPMLAWKSQEYRIAAEIKNVHIM